MLSAHELWERYSALWFLEPGKRSDELASCVSEDVLYCDPIGLVEGRLALSGYIDVIQESVPGGTFRVGTVQKHHDHSLARWTLQGREGDVVLTGTSYALVNQGHQLSRIAAFFDPNGPR